MGPALGSERTWCFRTFIRCMPSSRRLYEYTWTRHGAHYAKTYRHQQNRKCTRYRNAAKGGPTDYATVLSSFLKDRRIRWLFPALQSKQFAIMLVLNPAVGGHYFLPGLRLPSQPQNMAVVGIIYTAWLTRHNVCERLSYRMAAWRRNDRETDRRTDGQTDRSK